jgi:hypothetical protein
MFKFLKKDSFWLGLLLGIVLPAIVSGSLYYINITFPNSATGIPVFKKTTVLILGIVPNALALRYYLVNLKADKTGRGILAITFVYAIVFMIFYYL